MRLGGSGSGGGVGEEERDKGLGLGAVVVGGRRGLGREGGRVRSGR